MNLRVLTARENPKNGFTVVYKDLGIKDRLVMHYTADPDKDPTTAQGRAWIREVRRGMDSPKWAREMEGDPYSHVGKAIHPDFKREVHAAKPLSPIEGVNLIRGWDPGWCASACVWLQVLEGPKPDDIPQLRIYRELRSLRADFGQIVTKGLAITKREYPDFADTVWDEIDIAGKGNVVGRGETPKQILANHGVIVRHQKSKPEDRIDLFNFLLNSEAFNGEPAVLIDPRFCQHIITGCLGLYRRKEKSDRIDDTEVVHLFDAMGYGYYSHLALRFQKRQRPKPEKKSDLGWAESVIGSAKHKARSWLES